MSNTIKGRSFNLRISFDEAGEPCIGYVRGFYKASEVAVDLKDVPDSIVRAIAKALGIEKSERLLNLSKNTRKPALQQGKEVVNVGS